LPAKIVILFLRTIAPVDLLGFTKLGHFLDPFTQSSVLNVRWEFHNFSVTKGNIIFAVQLAKCNAIPEPDDTISVMSKLGEK